MCVKLIITQSRHEYTIILVIILAESYVRILIGEDDAASSLYKKQIVVYEMSH